MKSPLPGMDPYIEACGLWADFHNRLIREIHVALAQAVPEHYVVRTGERSSVVLVEAEGKETHPFLPDVSVTAASTSASTPSQVGGDGCSGISYRSRASVHASVHSRGISGNIRGNLRN